MARQVLVEAVAGRRAAQQDSSTRPVRTVTCAISWPALIFPDYALEINFQSFCSLRICRVSSPRSPTHLCGWATFTM